jgi:hypothetical protein
MTLSLKAKDEIWSKDGRRLGLADHIYHRIEEAEPELELYARYLHVFSTEIGDDYYVPLEFIKKDEEDGRFTIDLTMEEAMVKGWSRLPDFVAKDKSTKEELPNE